jgi:hypothetical protein
VIQGHKWRPQDEIGSLGNFPDCTFSDCGRRAISYNLYTNEPAGKHRVLSNLIVRNCEFKRGFHTTSIDVSCMKSTNDTIKNIYFYNNYIDDSEHISAQWGTSNQVFIQNGKEKACVDSIFIVNNVFSNATARNILFDGGSRCFVWNNTIVGHNPCLTRSPWGNIGCGDADTIDLRNNIIMGTLPNNRLENNLVHGFRSKVYFSNRDYNLYWQLNPGNNRNITSIDVNGAHHYYNMFEWNQYLFKFPDFDQNSPKPADPLFVNYEKSDFELTNNSPAANSGESLPYVIVTDPFNVKDTLNKYDINGNLRSAVKPSIGAYE